MKRIKIGNNDKADEQFDKDIKLKIDSFQKLVEYISSFNDNIDLQKLYERPFEYAIEATAADYQSAYKGAKIERVFEIIGFSVSKLEEYTRVIEGVELQFDPVTYEYKKPDNSYYIETDEQLKRYEAVKDICEAVKQIDDIPIHYGSLIQATRGLVLPDYKTQSIQPNLNYVLNGASAIMPR
jgi:hypothetical protein